MILNNAENITLKSMLQDFEEYKKEDHFDLFKDNPDKSYYQIFGMFIALSLDNELHFINSGEK